MVCRRTCVDRRARARNLVWNFFFELGQQIRNVIILLFSISVSPALLSFVYFDFIYFFVLLL